MIQAATRELPSEEEGLKNLISEAHKSWLAVSSASRTEQTPRVLESFENKLTRVLPRAKEKTKEALLQFYQETPSAQNDSEGKIQAAAQLMDELFDNSIENTDRKQLFAKYYTLLIEGDVAKNHNLALSHLAKNDLTARVLFVDNSDPAHPRISRGKRDLNNPNNFIYTTRSLKNDVKTDLPSPEDRMLLPFSDATQNAFKSYCAIHSETINFPPQKKLFLVQLISEKFNNSLSSNESVSAFEKDLEGFDTIKKQLEKVLPRAKPETIGALVFYYTMYPGTPSDFEIQCVARLIAEKFGNDLTTGRDFTSKLEQCKQCLNKIKEIRNFIEQATSEVRAREALMKYYLEKRIYTLDPQHIVSQMLPHNISLRVRLMQGIFANNISTDTQMALFEKCDKGIDEVERRVASAIPTETETRKRMFTQFYIEKYFFTESIFTHPPFMPDLDATIQFIARSFVHTLDEEHRAAFNDFHNVVLDAQQKIAQDLQRGGATEAAINTLMKFYLETASAREFSSSKKRFSARLFREKFNDNIASNERLEAFKQSLEKYDAIKGTLQQALPKNTPETVIETLIVYYSFSENHETEKKEDFLRTARLLVEKFDSSIEGNTAQSTQKIVLFKACCDRMKAIQNQVEAHNTISSSNHALTNYYLHKHVFNPSVSIEAITALSLPQRGDIQELAILMHEVFQNRDQPKELELFEKYVTTLRQLPTKIHTALAERATPPSEGVEKTLYDFYFDRYFLKGSIDAPPQIRDCNTVILSLCDLLEQERFRNGLQVQALAREFSAYYEACCQLQDTIRSAVGENISSETFNVLVRFYSRSGTLSDDSPEKMQLTAELLNTAFKNDLNDTERFELFLAYRDLIVPGNLFQNKARQAEVIRSLSERMPLPTTVLFFNNSTPNSPVLQEMQISANQNVTFSEPLTPEKVTRTVYEKKIRTFIQANLGERIITETTRNELIAYYMRSYESRQNLRERLEDYLNTTIGQEQLRREADFIGIKEVLNQIQPSRDTVLALMQFYKKAGIQWTEDSQEQVKFTAFLMNNLFRNDINDMESLLLFSTYRNLLVPGNLAQDASRREELIRTLLEEGKLPTTVLFFDTSDPKNSLLKEAHIDANGTLDSAETLTAEKIEQKIRAIYADKINAHIESLHVNELEDATKRALINYYYISYRQYKRERESIQDYLSYVTQKELQTAAIVMKNLFNNAIRNEADGIQFSRCCSDYEITKRTIMHTLENSNYSDVTINSLAKFYITHYNQFLIQKHPESHMYHPYATQLFDSQEVMLLTAQLLHELFQDNIQSDERDALFLNWYKRLQVGHPRDSAEVKAQVIQRLTDHPTDWVVFKGTSGWRKVLLGNNPREPLVYTNPLRPEDVQ